MSCIDILKKSPEFQIPGFTLPESTTVICNAVSLFPSSENESDLVKSVRSTRWPDLNKAVDGGLQHIVSTDNGANYAELWFKAGSWYAVTGAETADSSKVKKSESYGIYEIPNVYKGSGIDAAYTEFANSIFGVSRLVNGKKGCGCGS